MTKTFTLTLFFFFSFISLRAQIVVVNEVDYDQPGNDSAEFIELFNRDTINPGNLLNYVVILFNGSNSTVYDSIIMPSFLLSYGQHYVICNSGGLVPNCNLVHGASYDMIQNGAPDAIAIKHRISQTIVDAVSYEGACIAPYVEGTGAGTDNAAYPGVGLSRYPDGTDTQNNSADFHLACSTPGLANVNGTGACGSVSVDEINKKHTLFVHPNPATTHVSIFGMPHVRGVWNVSVFDLTGRQCINTNMEADNDILQLNVESLPAGFYNIVVSSDGYEGKQRLVVGSH
jgi:hypothetical protein